MATARQRQITIAIIFATLAVAALLLAQGTSQMLAGLVLESAPSAPIRVNANAASDRSEEAARRQKVGDARAAILGRNIFDFETGPVDGSQDVVEEEPVVQPEPVPEDPNAPPPDCEGSMRLVIAFQNFRRPEQSVAAIAGASGTVAVYRPGERIDERELITVDSSRVLLQPQNGRLCQLAMFQERQVSEEPQVMAPPDPGMVMEPPDRPQREGAISDEDLNNGIQQASDTQFTVSRSLVNQILENQAELMRTARIIPHEENGRTVGVKMYGIRRNSLLGRLGLNNGDMLRTINGFDMTEPNSALEAYARLRNADQLSVSVVRRGQPVTINYNVQ